MEIEQENKNVIVGVCGIIMPISAIDNCSEQHWVDVKTILVDTIQSAGFEANLVSNADDVGIIQKRIIQNIYDNPIVVCDVSGKNPNVMFELGMRLAFDKPIIIIKDNVTSYSFDTSPIEHLTYPRDLRFNKIVEFKKELKEKIIGTYKKSQSDPSYTTFLKNFGKFTVAKLDTTEVSQNEFLLEEMQELKSLILNSSQRNTSLWNKMKKDDFDDHLRCEDDMKNVVQQELINLPPEMPISLKLKKIENNIIREKSIPCYDKMNESCRERLKDVLRMCMQKDD